MKCKICSREAKRNGYCSLHLKAYVNVVEKFEIWKLACNVTWEGYLIEVQKNSLTGEWAKDVAKYLIEEEHKDVK